MGMSRGNLVFQPLAYANYFGRRFQGSIRGTVAPFRIVTVAGGPLLAGVLYEVNGSYGPAFLLLAASSVVAGVLAFFARPPRRPSDAGPSE